MSTAINTNAATLSNSFLPGGEANFGKAIVEGIERLGLGTLSKSDFEAFLFYHLQLNIDESKVKDNYDWMSVLKISAQKLRALQSAVSARYYNLDMEDMNNWLLFAKKFATKRIEIEDAKKGTIRFFIDDSHLQRFIEKIVYNYGSSLDYALNRGQVILKYDVFHLIIEKLVEVTDIEKELIGSINEDKGEAAMRKKVTSIKEFFNDFKKELKNTTLQEGSKKVFDLVVGKALEIAKNKLIGNK